jgi:hypothetical protein
LQEVGGGEVDEEVEEEISVAAERGRRLTAGDLHASSNSISFMAAHIQRKTDGQLLDPQRMTKRKGK